jgi:signal peptidase I
MTLRSRLSFSLTTFLQRFSLPLAVGVVVSLFFQYLSIVRVSGDSMNPTLRNGQYLLRFERVNYQSGDVVVLRPPVELQTRASRFVKRLIALPGDTVSIQNDKVYLNGEILRESYVAEISARAENFPDLVISKGEVVAFEGFALAELPDYLQDTFAMLEPLPQGILEQSQTETVTYVGTVKLDEGFYFVLGDNRGFSASEDSRLFGAISASQLQGVTQSF